MANEGQLIADKKYLKSALDQIYSAATFPELQSIFRECLSTHPQYHDIFEAALNERSQEIVNDTPKSSFKEKGKSTKKKWLMSLIIYYFMQCSIMIFAHVINLSKIDVDKELFISKVIILVSIVVNSCFAWALYHCAYRKNGTKLLSLIVFIYPLTLINSIVKEGFDWSMPIFNVLYFTAFGFFWISSINLRSINVKEKGRQQLALLKEII
jgi:hypothetical protein